MRLPPPTDPEAVVMTPAKSRKSWEAALEKGRAADVKLDPWEVRLMR